MVEYLQRPALLFKTMNQVNSVYRIFCNLLTICMMALILQSLSSMSLKAAPESIQAEGVFPIRIDKKWGFINGKGNVVVKPKYDAVGEYSDGLMSVYLDGKAGYINSAGEEVIRPQFDTVHPFQNGKAIVQKGEAHGIIDREGRFTEVSYDIVSDFSEGLARIRKTVQIESPKPRKEPAYGYIDMQGRVVIEPQFINASDFTKDGLAVVMRSSEDAFIYINKEGKEVLRAPYGGDQIKAQKFEHGLVRIRENGRWGYKNTKGEWAITPRFEQASDFIPLGRAFVSQNMRSFWINAAGEESPPPEFEPAGEFKEGLCLASKNGQNWYINPNGELAFPFEPFDQLSYFSCGRAAVRRDRLWGYLDTEGKLAIPLQFTSAPAFERGLAFVGRQDGSYGYINTAGEAVWFGGPPKKVALQPLDFSGLEAREKVYAEAAKAQEAFYKRMEEQEKEREKRQEEEARRMEEELKFQKEQHRKINEAIQNKNERQDEHAASTAKEDEPETSASKENDLKSEKKSKLQRDWEAFVRDIKKLFE